MIEGNSTLPNESAGNKEIPISSLERGILSIPNETKRVEATRIALRYLLEEGRMAHSVDLLAEIHLEKLPFVDGERNNMLKSILTVAKNKCREDPSDAYTATENIRYFMWESKKGRDNTLLTKEEWGKFDTEALANTSVIVTGRLIECLLNPKLPRGRYKEYVTTLKVEHIVMEAEARGYLKEIYDSLLPEAKQQFQLNPDILDHIKKNLGEILTAGSTERPVGETAAEETEEIGEISDFNNDLLEWQHRDYQIRIHRAFTPISWAIFFSVNNESVHNNGGLHSQNFNLESALKKFEDKGLEPDTAEKICQALARSFLNGLKKREQIFLDLLREFPGRISLDDPNSKKIFFVDKNISPPPPFIYSYHLNRERTWIVTPTTLTEDDIKKLDPEIMRLLNVEIGKAALETWIKNSPTPSASAEKETTHKPVIEEVAIGGDSSITRLTVDGKDLGYIFVKQGQGHYSLDSGYNREDTLKDLDIPEDMEVYFDIKPNPSSASKFERISIIGGEGAKLNLKELYSLEILNRPVVGIFTTKYEGWEERASKGLGVGRGGQAVRHNLNANASVYDIHDLPIGTWMSTEELEDYLKTRKEEIVFEKLTEAEAATVGETLQSQVSVKEPEPEAKPKAKVEVIPISGQDGDYNDLVKLKIGGRESQIIWKQNGGVFDLTEFRQTRKQLMLPNGTRLRIGKYILGEGRSVSLIITGGKSTGISIRDLIYFKDNNNASITLEINNGGNWSEDEAVGLNEKSGKAILNSYSIGSGEAEEKITHGLSVKQAVTLLKESLEKAKA